MLSALTHLALEVKYLDRAREFYVDHFGLEPVAESADEVVFRTGETAVVLRRPSGVPRGGLHVHYAFATGADAYEAWESRLSSLSRAVERYRELGFAVVDRGDDRQRVRLRGPVDLELWEPQLGIADARGGVHVDLGFETADPNAAREAVADDALAVEELADGVRITDPDGHSLTFQ